MSVSAMTTDKSRLPNIITKKMLVAYFRRRDGSCTHEALGNDYFTDLRLEQIGITREFYDYKRKFDIDISKRIYEVFEITSLEE